LKVKNKYHWYGEFYGNTTGFNTTLFPKLILYTSDDMVIWTNMGTILQNEPGSQFTPWVVYNPTTNMYVLWYNNYANGCCSGNFGVAQSPDGIVWKQVGIVNPVYKNVDSSGLFVDDDDTGYVFYSSIDNDHKVSIEKLTPDYLNTTFENYGFFPDRYVEGQYLFKRNETYYASYGSCCCWCRGGSGAIFFSAINIKGPWIRLGFDKNCEAHALVCGAYGDRSCSPLTIPAQGLGIAQIPSKAGGFYYMWMAERWLSAPDNPPGCPDECRPTTGICAAPPTYVKGHGFTYWYVLKFDEVGHILPFDPFVYDFEIDI